ncbi:unnamed protein product, partial [Pylaiella littoralis]
SWAISTTSSAHVDCPSEVPKANCPGGSMAAPEGDTSSCRENVLGPRPHGKETVDVLTRQASPVPSPRHPAQKPRLRHQAGSNVVQYATWLFQNPRSRH